MWQWKHHVALSTADPYITKEDIADLDAAMFLRSGSDSVSHLQVGFGWW